MTVHHSASSFSAAVGVRVSRGINGGGDNGRDEADRDLASEFNLACPDAWAEAAREVDGATKAWRVGIGVIVFDVGVLIRVHKSFWYSSICGCPCKSKEKEKKEEPHRCSDWTSHLFMVSLFPVFLKPFKLDCWVYDCCFNLWEWGKWNQRHHFWLTDGQGIKFCPARLCRVLFEFHDWSQNCVGKLR